MSRQTRSLAGYNTHMYALISREKIQLFPGTVVRMPGSWQTYRALCDGRGDGSMERAEMGGIEPDYCFYIDNWQAVVGKDRINWQSDPPPDLVIEIDVTSYTDVEDYLLYGVPEVWLLKNNQLSISLLEAGQYQIKTVSRYFPEIDLQELVRQCLQTANQQGTGTAIRDLRASLAKSKNLD